MSRLFRSTEVQPFARGHEFGRAHGPRIAATIAGYRAAWEGVRPGFDPLPHGLASLVATEAYAPHLREEMDGMAEGAESTHA